MNKLPFNFEKNQEEIFLNPRVTIHGIDIPKNSNMIWIYQNMSFPDNFLHIVLV